MKTHWLLSSLLVLLALPGLATTQDSHPVPPPPSAEEATDADADQMHRNPPAADTTAGVPELLPPGKTGSSPDENSRIRVYQPPQIRLPAHPVSVVDAVVLTHNHVSDEVLAHLVRQYGIERPLAASDLVTLHNEGVSQAVILAMQQGPAPVVSDPAPILPPPPISARPLIIQEYRYLAPPPVRFYYHAPYRPYYGPHWGVSIYGR